MKRIALAAIVMTAIVVSAVPARAEPISIAIATAIFGEGALVAGTTAAAIAGFALTAGPSIGRSMHVRRK